MSAKTVAWLWPNPDGTSECTFVDPLADTEFSSALALCLGREPHQLVLRSDWEAEHTRAEQLALDIAEAKKINKTFCDLQDEEDSEREYVSNEEERVGCNWDFHSGPPMKLVNTRAERAEAALREWLVARDSLIQIVRRDGFLKDEVDAATKRVNDAIAAARAIVEGEGR